MPIRTIDVENLRDVTGNKYEMIVILSKRARQVAAQEKLQLDEKLQYFEGFEDDDEFSFNEEQEQISKSFEKLPHAALMLKWIFLTSVISVPNVLDAKVGYFTKTITFV